MLAIAVFLILSAACSGGSSDDEGDSQPPPEICGSGVDVDGDGLIDCDDPDCANEPECMNGDSGDGDTDGTTGGADSGDGETDGATDTTDGGDGDTMGTVDTDGGSGGDDGGPTDGDGIIRGSVRSSSGIPLNAVHVRLVNTDDTNLQMGAFSGIGPNLTFDDGEFEIASVPPGTYKILIEKLDNRSNAFDQERYSEFTILENPAISFPDEYYNGSDESAIDDPGDFIIISVSPGEVVGGIDFITNN